MTNKTKKPGHIHDFDLTPVVNIRYAEARKLKHCDATGKKGEPDYNVPSEGVAHGTGVSDINVGVLSDEILFGLNLRGNGWADPELVVMGNLPIENAEHLIRALMTCVIQAKKNAIDKPSPFGGSRYSPLPLTEDESDDEAERYTVEYDETHQGWMILDGGAAIEGDVIYSDSEAAQQEADRLNATA